MCMVPDICQVPSIWLWYSSQYTCIINSAPAIIDAASFSHPLLPPHYHYYLLQLFNDRGLETQDKKLLLTNFGKFVIPIPRPYMEISDLCIRLLSPKTCVMFPHSVSFQHLCHCKHVSGRCANMLMKNSSMLSL